MHNTWDTAIIATPTNKTHAYAPGAVIDFENHPA